MYEPTLSMAMMNFLPVIFFGIGSVYLLRIGYHILNQSIYTAMAGGAVLCFTGGFYKATSKLLDATSGYQIDAFESIQFVLMAPGFVLLFIAALALNKHKGNRGKKVLAVSPAMALWKIPFITVMTLFNMGFLIAMAFYSLKNQLRIPALLYLLSMLTMFLMAYLATLPSTTTMNWIDQSVNSIVQFLAMTGHILLYYGLDRLNKVKPYMEV